MDSILIISIVILATIIGGLVLFIYNLIRKPKIFDKSDPEFVKLETEFLVLKDKLTTKDDYITQLKSDKQILVDNAKNADSFKEISEKSFQEYNSLVQEYRNFHEKLIGNFKYQGAYNEKKLQRLLEKNGLVKDQDFTVREGQISKDIIVKPTRM